MKIVSSCTCPVGSAAGHDADECRANLLEDGSVLCVICGTVYPKMSDRMRQVWRAICSSGFRVPSVQLGSATKPGTEAYGAACLSGYDPNLSDMVRATFCSGKESVHLDYELSNEAEIDNPDLSLTRKPGDDELAALPERTRKCVKALEELGFRVRHIQTTAPARVAMSCGRPVGSMGFVLGASVVLSWQS